MKRSAKIATLTLGMLLVLGLLGAGAVFAQTPTPSTTTATDWQSVFLGKVATILGVDQQKLADAMTQAAKETRNEQIDQAVRDGRMSQEYGNWLKQRPDDGSLGIKGFGFGRGGHFDLRLGGRGFGKMPPAQATPTPGQTQ